MSQRQGLDVRSWEVQERSNLAPEIQVISYNVGYYTSEAEEDRRGQI